MKRRAAIAAILLLVVAGCVSDDRPESCDATEVVIEISVTAETMSPSDPGVCRGQAVTFVIDPTTDGFFHIHGYDEAVPITELTRGEEVQLDFVADRSGQFAVELHPEDDPDGIGIGIFTVYEP